MSYSLGGGEILKYFNSDASSNFKYNKTAIFAAFPIFKLIIYVLLLIIMVMALAKIFHIKSPLTKRGVLSEVDNIKQVRHRDRFIIRSNKFISSITNFIESSPLALSKTSRDYWQYNINRLGIRVPGGYRNLKALEFHALIQLLSLVLVAFGILIILFVNLTVGILWIVFTVVMTNTMPMIIVRNLVKDKDLEIKLGFTDFYLMIHYVILSGMNTSLSSVIKSYDKTTSSTEMHRLVDVCVHYIDTYGEYKATKYIAQEYKEIAEVNKLMRLIRQANEGGSVKEELDGFRNELINQQKFNREKAMKQIIKKAELSFYLLAPVLVQAVLSATAIYFPDLGLLKGLIS